MKYWTAKIISRLDSIEIELDEHHRVYNRSARHSDEHRKALTAMNNLYNERHMLEAALTANKLAKKGAK